MTRAVLDDAPSSLVSPDDTSAIPSYPGGRLPLPAAVVVAAGSGRLARPALAAGDIPTQAWNAYLRAAAVLAEAAPRCQLDWTVLAAIGLVESDHGRSLPDTGRRADPRRAAPDTDGGRLDGDPDRDVPVGPMRLLPSTWTVIGVDGDGDGVRSPADIDDAALGVGVALCAGDARLDTTAGLHRALLRYAPSPAYVDLVIRIADIYAHAGLDVPSATVTAIAHPVVDGTLATLGRPSLARRVKATQAVAAATVGVGSSASAQLLAAALPSAMPPTAGPSAKATAAEAVAAEATAAEATQEPTAEPSAAATSPADDPGPATNAAAGPSDPPAPETSSATSTETSSAAPSPDPTPAAPAADPPPAPTETPPPPAETAPAETCPTPDTPVDGASAPPSQEASDPAAPDPTVEPAPCADPTADPTAGAAPPADGTVSPLSPPSPASG